MLDRIQIVGANYHYVRYSLDYFINSMQRFGLTRIEFYAAEPHMYVDDYTPAMAQAVRRKLSAAGISVACFTPEQCNYPINIAAEDELIRLRSIRYYERTIELAAAMESPLIQIVGGRGLYDGNQKSAWGRSAEALAHFADIAAGYGLTMVLEASNWVTSTVINTTEDIIKMLDELGRPNLKGMIDTNALYDAGEEFERAVQLLGDRLCHVHFMDARPDAHELVPGEGVLPMDEYIKTLAKYGYKGSLTPEFWGLRYAEKPDDAIRRYLDYCLPLCRQA